MRSAINNSRASLGDAAGERDGISVNEELPPIPMKLIWAKVRPLKLSVICPAPTTALKTSESLLTGAVPLSQLAPALQLPLALPRSR